MATAWPGARREDFCWWTNCTDEDPGLRIESFAVINLRGVNNNNNNNNNNVGLMNSFAGWIDESRSLSYIH
jgi:hypothetical protein